jgi:hypothetical protein
MGPPTNGGPIPQSRAGKGALQPNSGWGLGAERIELSTPRLKGMSPSDLRRSEFGWSACSLDS